MTANLATRITSQTTNGSLTDLPVVTVFVDGLALSTITLFDSQPGQPEEFIVKDLQSGRSFPITGSMNAERIASQIAKAYLFDVVCLFGTDKLPE